MTTVNEKVTAIFLTLNADATLRGTSYLNGSGKIFKFATRPAGYSGEALTMNLFPAAIEGEQSFMDEDLLRLVLYMPNQADMTPIMTRAGNIENRIAALLDLQSITNGGKTFKPRRDIPGRLLPIDPEATEEHAWAFQYFLRSM